MRSTSTILTKKLLIKHLTVRQYLTTRHKDSIACMLVQKTLIIRKLKSVGNQRMEMKTLNRAIQTTSTRGYMWLMPDKIHSRLRLLLSKGSSNPVLLSQTIQTRSLSLKLMVILNLLIMGIKSTIIGQIHKLIVMRGIATQTLSPNHRPWPMKIKQKSTTRL